MNAFSGQPPAEVHRALAVALAAGSHDADDR
jgi:hypothetical protein